ncbi:isopenicillin N synthase family oxygenase [Caldimonas thermodepolymerans]|nr:2-oxoglutarate and iron-dependent oxygenase domain-containing protein [Caldimonas thermodepolymerans]QPC31654.1 isopenicillin N synthase family oxygenase [Caldimonas thermodepolymerans]RDH94849.1 isopenicillin N synthase-like dioxygenase [Caldimonas thermodepolymerans]
MHTPPHAALDHVPVVDIAPFLHGTPAQRQAVAGEVDRINREIGFLVVTGHGLDLALLDRWFEVSREFFAAPAEVKQAVLAAPGTHHGYHAMAASGLAAKEGETAPPDLREYFMVGHLDGERLATTPSAARFHRANRWPSQPAGFAAVAPAYYRAMEALGATLMRLFAMALGLPEHWFDDKIDRHFSVLSTIHYPAQKVEPLPGQLRAGAHTDYGSLTILAPSDAPGGLQVRSLTGEWMDVPYLRDGFVINIGDMMQRWTNDRWRSNFHRVVNPPPGSPLRPRQSIAYFLHPNDDAQIACIPTCVGRDGPLFEPIQAGDYMWEKEHAIAAAQPVAA